jgi:hypothetical protein
MTRMSRYVDARWNSQGLLFAIWEESTWERTKKNDAEIAEILCDHGSNLRECIHSEWMLRRS